MSKQLDELLDKYAWNSLQIQQLRIADKKHLDLSYFSTKYDWEQMREIRLCLEDGMDPSFICDPHISAKSMQKSREAISHMSGTFDEKIEKIKQQKQIRIILLVVCILIMLAGFIIAMWQKDYLLSMINPLELELVSESEIRGVSEVPEIHYIDFVKDYTDGSELILPDTVITGVGDYTLTYTVKSQTKETQRTMVLIIETHERTVAIKTHLEMSLGELRMFFQCFARIKIGDPISTKQADKKDGEKGHDDPLQCAKKGNLITNA